jgi:hypothetical protein
MTIKSGIDGTTLNSFLVGDGVDTTKYIYVNNGDANSPGIRYNASTSVFQVSNDGVNWFDLLSQSDTPLIITHTTTLVNTFEPAALTINNSLDSTIQYQVFTTIRNKLDINCHLSVCNFGITSLSGVYKFIGHASTTLTTQECTMFLETDDAVDDMRFLVDAGTGVLTFQYKSSAVDAYCTSVVLYGAQLSGFFISGGSSSGIVTLIGDITAGPSMGTTSAVVSGIDDKLIYPDPSAVSGSVLVLRESQWLYENTSIPTIFGHRLSLSSSSPTPISDISSSSTLYLVPDTSSYFHLFGGTFGWYLCNVDSAISTNITGGSDTETAISLPGMYDVFIHSHNYGVSFKWDFIPRAGNIPTVSIVRQNGAYVLNTDRTKRWIGCVFSFDGTTISDTQKTRCVWNYYNRKERAMSYTPTLFYWTPTTLTDWMLAEGSINDYILCINGEGGDLIHAKATTLAAVTNVLDTNATVASGIGVDTIAINSAITHGTHIPNDSGIHAIHSSVDKVLDQGVHYIFWLERTNTASIYFISNYTNDDLQSGMSGYFLM